MRQIYNYKILAQLSRIIWCYPDLRFTQILSMLGLDKDNFYEEPKITYERIFKWMHDHDIIA